jgi:hypothetical protein
MIGVPMTACRPSVEISLSLFPRHSILAVGCLSSSSASIEPV